MRAYNRSGGRFGETSKVLQNLIDAESSVGVDQVEEGRGLACGGGGNMSTGPTQGGMAWVTWGPHLEGSGKRVATHQIVAFQKTNALF